MHGLPLTPILSLSLHQQEIAMTASAQQYPRLAALIDNLSDWLKKWRERSEMSELDSGEFDRIAHEMGLAPADLDALVRQGRHAADELPYLLKALGFDDDAIARIERPVLNDMLRTCAGCQHKQACQHDLAAGVVAQRYETYCANADTVGALVKAAE
jgi:hypothetical protein